MPIADDMKNEYPAQWEDLRESILERASWTIPPGEDVTAIKIDPRCEKCGKPHGQTVVKGPDGTWVDETWLNHPLGPDRPVWRNEEGDVLAHEYTGERSAETVDVVLTLSHTCQDPRCDSTECLRALCQRCHLSYDAQPGERARREKVQAEIRGQQSMFGGHGCQT